jgi:DNA-binding transcriptional ArsR family regulator
VSYKIVDAIIGEEDFLPTEKLVTLVLARHADDETRIAWPSARTICRESGLKRRTVQRTLRSLEKLGIILDVTTDNRKGKPAADGRMAKVGGRNHSTRYEIAPEEEILARLLERFDRERKTKQRHYDAPKSVPVTHLSAPSVHIKSVTTTHESVSNRSEE